MAPSKVSLKLLIDKTGRRVLFAEAGKDFIDFLFSLLTLPIGTVIRLLDNKGMVGCLPKLYQSVADLNNDYMQSNQQKDVLLKPESLLSFVSPQVPLLPLEERSSPSAAQTSAPISYCFGGSYVPKMASAPSLFSGSCPAFGCTTSNVFTSYVPKMAPAPSAVAEGGFVKGVVKYMVMDDLVVAPMSTISSITLLIKFNIKEVSALEEKVVHIGMDEGLELLKHALASNTVLTNVFLGEVGFLRQKAT